jgi:hypothetical protein
VAVEILAKWAVFSVFQPICRSESKKLVVLSKPDEYYCFIINFQSLGLSNLRFLLIFAGALLSTNVVFAAEQVAIFEAETYVSDQSESTRADAFREAFSQVVIKATGSRLALDSVADEALDKNVEQLVQSFSYQDNPDFLVSTEAPDSGDSSVPAIEEIVEPEVLPKVSAPFILKTKFSKPLVEKRLTLAGVPLWGQLRPEISIWIVEQASGTRNLLGEEDVDAYEAARSAESTHGLPLILPTADLRDQSSVELSDIWGLFPSAAEKAAERYGSDLELLARLQTDGSLWSVDWLMPLGGEIISSTTNALTRGEALSSMLAGVAEAMSKRYAFVRDSNGGGVQIQAEVEAIDSFSDYVSVISHFEQLSGVASVSVEKVKGTQLTLVLQLLGGVTVLERELALAGKLQPREIRFDSSIYSDPQRVIGEPGGEFGVGSPGTQLLRYIWLPETNS